MNRRKLLFTGLCSAAVVGLSTVGASAEDKIAPKTLEFLEATTISGYVEASYVANVKADVANVNDQNDEKAGGTAFGSSGAGVNHLRAFDNNIGFTMNAVKLVLEKPLGEGDWAAGYRADLFGEDANQLNRAEGTGNPNFNGGGAVGTYIEQGYVAFRVPVGNGIDFKAGRFVALSGYEVIESPANLNFSRGLLFTWATPLAHTGLLGSYRFNDNIDAQIGVVNGWNTWIDDTSAPAFIARVGAKNSSGTMSFGVSTYYGQARVLDPAYGDANDTGPLKLANGERWFVDGVANFKPTEKVLLGLEALVGSQRLGGDGPGSEVANNAHDQWWGVAGYGKVQVTDQVSLAGRGELLNDKHGFLFDDDHASFDPTYDTDVSGDRVKVWEVTGTVNFDVWKNMLLRFEARYDQACTHGLHPVDTPAPFEPKDSQLTFAVDAVYSF